MAAKQIFSVPSYLYTMIDNVSAQSFPTLSDATHCGYDTMAVIPDYGAATAQGQNPLGAETNGSVPDFWIDQKSILNNPATATILFLNPS